jgi:hypothetical protein
MKTVKKDFVSEHADFIIFICCVIGLFLIAFAMGGCNSDKACQRKLARLEKKCPGEFQIHDSIIYGKPIVRESKTTDTVILPGTVKTFSISVPCPDAKNFTYTKHYSAGNATASINNNILTIHCPTDSLMKVYNNFSDSVFQSKTIDKSGLATKTVTVYETHWYDIAGRVSFIFLIIYAFIRELLPLIMAAIKPKL